MFQWLFKERPWKLLASYACPDRLAACRAARCFRQVGTRMSRVLQGRAAKGGGPAIVGHSALVNDMELQLAAPCAAARLRGFSVAAPGACGSVRPQHWHAARPASAASGEGIRGWPLDVRCKSVLKAAWIAC